MLKKKNISLSLVATRWHKSAADLLYKTIGKAIEYRCNALEPGIQEVTNRIASNCMTRKAH
jgi:hypothetical protein